MKKQLPGFIAGLLCAVVLFGVVGGAGALITGPASINVSPINIMVNGQVFQPKNVNGELVDVFKYGGTTYVPLRAIAEAFGLEVGYDAEKNLATVNKKEAAQDPVRNTENGEPVPTTAVNQDGKEVRFTVSSRAVFINGEKQTMNIAKCDGADYYNVNLVMQACGLGQLSNQKIIELIKVGEETWNQKYNYLLIDNAVCTTARCIASCFDLNASFNGAEHAIEFSIKE